jgi:hypothetical protein
MSNKDAEEDEEFYICPIIRKYLHEQSFRVHKFQSKWCRAELYFPADLKGYNPLAIEKLINSYIEKVASLKW